MLAQDDPDSMPLRLTLFLIVLPGSKSAAADRPAE